MPSVQMKQLLLAMSYSQNIEEEIKLYYCSFFSNFNPLVLFQVYDIHLEAFISFPGKEGSMIINRNTLIRGLTDMEIDHGKVTNLLILEFNKNEIAFIDPVFIGSLDSYYSNKILTYGEVT